jgi:ParB-like chromosome segregation protein Spo0J
MNKINIEYIHVDDLKEYENNAKIHTEEQVLQIMDSIKKFGMNDPIAVWKDNVIIEGHGRLTACKELGITEVPIIRLEHMDDEQRKAYGLVHNKLTMNTGFDDEKLSIELDEIEMDMSGFGFIELADLDVDGFFEDAEPKEESEPEAKEVQCPHCGMFFEVE